MFFFRKTKCFTNGGPQWPIVSWTSSPLPSSLAPPQPPQPPAGACLRAFALAVLPALPSAHRVYRAPLLQGLAGLPFSAECSLSSSSAVLSVTLSPLNALCILYVHFVQCWCLLPRQLHEDRGLVCSLFDTQHGRACQP